MIWTYDTYKTEPLTVFEAGGGWQRISSMRMRRRVTDAGWLRIPRSRWQPWEEITVMYVKDGVWHQPADVAAAHAERSEASTAPQKDEATDGV